MTSPDASPANMDSPPSAPAGEPLRSVHTASFAVLLEQLGISLLVSTYQAGKVVVLRSEHGVLNTHFCGFNKPMGMALSEDRLAVATALEIWEYHNLPAVAQQLEPVGRHDACFLPRRAHVTGNVQTHELAWADEELWFVNTRFSCLCTLDDRHNFVPRWKPEFISQIAPEDRCHLNGLGLYEGQPRFVTALGTTDTAAGWRDHKRDGGVLIDIATNEVLLSGLSMPHSPRWYDGRLWVLNSGEGQIGYVSFNRTPQARAFPASESESRDRNTRACGVRLNNSYVPLAALPGFTRGLDFCGRYAFVGLSQVRESAVFSGIQIAERPQAERFCGVWVIDIVTGEIVAWVKFEDALQEIFAVCVVPNRRWPEITNSNIGLISNSFVLPEEVLDVVPSELLKRVAPWHLGPAEPQPK